MRFERLVADSGESVHICVGGGGLHIASEWTCISYAFDELNPVQQVV